MNDLRALGRELREAGRMVAVLASETDGKIIMVAACADDAGIKAGDLLRRLLPQIGGKGGGDAALAQGGGTATPEQLQSLLAEARKALN